MSGWDQVSFRIRVPSGGRVFCSSVLVKQRQPHAVSYPLSSVRLSGVKILDVWSQGTVGKSAPPTIKRTYGVGNIDSGQGNDGEHCILACECTAGDEY